MQMLLLLKRFEHVVNLQPIEKNAEPRRKLPGTSAKHRPDVSKLSTLPEKIKKANQTDNLCT